MATPTGTPPGFNPWQTTQAPSPPMASYGGENEDGVTIRAMRLKVLYTFDDQNKTNCLARWPHVLQIQTVAMDETTSIGVIELKTCIEAIVQCSPELVARLGQDYTVYAYDYSEYDNPLVGQGMLSRALSTASPTPDVPANQSRQLITGRVCKNILGLFANGVKETLEVKLRLVPVPTMLQGEYQNTMERYRELSKSIPPGSDVNEWNSFLQSNPNLGQMAKKLSPAPAMNTNLRDGMTMEVVNQLLSPHLQQPPPQDTFNQANFNQSNFNQNTFNQSGFTPVNAENSGNESRGTTAGDKAKKTSRPSSRVSVKRPRARKPKAAAANGGNTSGYEEGTDGDEGPAPKKRAKVTKADWNSNTTLGTSDSLRVAAGTSGSLRLFRPIAMSPQLQAGGPPGNHFVEVPRAPTPVPHLPNQHIPRDQFPQSSFQRDSFTSQAPREHISPYPPLHKPEDEVVRSIESAQPSPERFSPAESLPDIGSSPPVMRTRPPSTIRSSPPCPSSPVLPQMPRTDSGFMSGSLDDLFGDEDEQIRPADDDLEIVAQEEFKRRSAPRRARSPFQEIDYNFVIEEEVPGPPELLPTRMPKIGLPKQVEARARAAINLAGSVVSEDGQVLPPHKNSNRPPMRRAMSQPDFRPLHQQYQPQKSSLGPKPQHAPSPLPELQQLPRHQSLSQPPPEVQHPVQNEVLQPPPEIQYPMQNDGPPPRPDMQYQIQIDASQPRPEIWYPMQTDASQPQPDIQHQPQQIFPPFTSGESASVTDSTPLETIIPVPAFEPAPVQISESTSLPAPPPAPRSRPASRSGMKVRTASMGSLTLPQIPASDPVLPPSSLQRSQTWSEAPMPPGQYMQQPMPPGMNFPRPPLNANGVPYGRTMQSKKASMKQKLELALANGQMPPFCANCGAIDTPTWRKAWSQDLEGIPGYHEYSDEPGRVTTIVISERDNEGKPTKYKLVKKFLGPGELQKDFDEFLLCNPCGIWMSKYKTQRPEERWESNGWQERSRGDKKRGSQRPPRSKKSQAAFPTSEAYFPQSDIPASDANFPQSEAPGPPEGISPGDMTSTQPQAVATEQYRRQRSTSAPRRKRLNAMTSDAASAALRRAIQSSPARWAGTQHSPIEVEDELGSTRRLLFPSPRKDGSPKVLGEVAVNVVQIATEFRSPKESMVDIESQDKENCPPAIDENDVDAELLQLFEDEMTKGDETERPSTPTQKSPAQNPFKTPTRPTPNHRPITRSVSRSIRSVRSAKSPSQLLMFTRTPSRTPGTGNRRRSPRNHDSVFESPFTATLNQLMSEANNQTSPIRNGMELDFGSLPDLSNVSNNYNVDMNFNLEDFFSTDVPMPSSPPRMFNLYEDPTINNMNVNHINWEEFGHFDPKDLQGRNEEVVIKDEPQASPTKLPAARKEAEGAGREKSI